VLIVADIYVQLKSSTLKLGICVSINEKSVELILPLKVRLVTVVRSAGEIKIERFPAVATFNCFKTCACTKLAKHRLRARKIVFICV
jgi:hypothetical protein